MQTHNLLSSPLFPDLAANCGFNQVHPVPPPFILSQGIARHTVPGRIQIWDMGGGVKKTKNQKKASEKSLNRLHKNTNANVL
jgi:hypothetical protein